VEQPPNDLASLLKIFPSNPPPVIRKRGKELLDVVREALKPSSSQQDFTTKQPDTTPEIPSAKESAPPVVVTKETSVIMERDIWAAGEIGLKVFY
jgi:exosome complex exonuclease RRP6